MKSFDVWELVDGQWAKENRIKARNRKAVLQIYYDAGNSIGTVKVRLA